MDTRQFLQYPDSLSLLEDEEPHYGPAWTGEDESPYKLDSSHHTPCAGRDDRPIGDRLDSDGQGTVITESMSVTESDEEKLQLLNKNTDLRRLNGELMKLNQEWDEIYRRTTENLQHTVRALEYEVQSLRQHSDKMSFKLEHEQNKKAFYENSLLQEMKRNQKLQDYVRQLESTLHYNRLSQRGVRSAADISRAHSQADLAPTNPSHLAPQTINSEETTRDHKEKPTSSTRSQESSRDQQKPHQSPRGIQYIRGQSLDVCESEQDVSKLKDQLQALKCQTEIYAADYKTEHSDRERMRCENHKLRQKERDMREQMLVLQEQLKIYEDDFRKERSDKQVLQRLLKSRSPGSEAVLVHRCNNVGHQEGRSDTPPRGSRERQPPPCCVEY